MPGPPSSTQATPPPQPSARCVELLRDPASYPESPGEIELRETHISWVFLTETHAYKLKKPVKFEFLDFSTPALRQHACQEELRLNRRLAGDIYQQVVPIAEDDSGRLALCGKGQRLDWLVVMRRLADDDALSARLAAERATASDLDRIAARLVQFYGKLPPCQIEPAAYRETIEHHIRGNFAELLQAGDHLHATAIRRVHAAQLDYLLTRPTVFDARVAAGRVVEGHGDLRPEHIYLTPEPVVIDCIEFNAEFRRIDMLDELAFLAMECAHRGYPAVGTRILEQALAAAGDCPPAALRAFYTAYRACVRAKVSVLRAGQLPETEQPAAWAEAARYLELAEAECHHLGPPRLIVVRGPAGVGKTTVAKALAEKLALEHLSTDALRRELFGEQPAADAHNQGRYTPANRRQVYEELFSRAATNLASGVSCVLDGTFLTRDLLATALQTAKAHHAAPLVVDCTCPAEIAAARIAQRETSGKSLSEARASTHARQREELDPPPPAAAAVALDTTQPLPSAVAHILASLAK